MKYIGIFFLLFFFNPSFAEPVKFGDWIFSYKIDKITGKNLTHIFTRDENKNSGVSIAFNCEVFAILNMNNKNDMDWYPTVFYRVDEDKPHETIFFTMNKFYLTTDFNEIFNDIKNGNNLLIRVVNSGYSFDASFSLKGITKAYNRLQQECKNQ